MSGKNYECLEKTLSLKQNSVFLDKINTVSVYVMQLFSTAIIYPNTKKK